MGKNILFIHTKKMVSIFWIGQKIINNLHCKNKFTNVHTHTRTHADACTHKQTNNHTNYQTTNSPQVHPFLQKKLMASKPQQVSWQQNFLHLEHPHHFLLWLDQYSEKLQIKVTVLDDTFPMHQIHIQNRTLCNFLKF